MFGRFHGGFNGTFESRYRCYSVACIDKPQLENGDKVILPPSALDRLASLNIDYPMLFNVCNEKDARESHCGVLEFIADEGVMYMPHWMMQNLLLNEGDLAKLKSATLAKGTYVKLRPHTQDFLQISNPKAVLETTLRNYSCMTVGDSFMVNYNNKRYYVDVEEAKPSNAICIIETDCEVDFAPPLDYEEPTRPTPPPAAAPPAPRLGGRPAEKEAEAPPPEPKFMAFQGAAKRLDGKAASPAPLPAAGVGEGNGAAGSSGRSSQIEGAAGKVMFGAPVASAALGGARKPGEPLIKKKVKSKKPKEPEPEPEPTFKAFQGQGNKLK